MGITSVPQRIKSLPRLPQIVRVLIKYGFGDVVSRIGIDRGLHQLRTAFGSGRRKEFESLTTEERIRIQDLLQSASTFSKIGNYQQAEDNLVKVLEDFDCTDQEARRGLMALNPQRYEDERGATQI